MKDERYTTNLLLYCSHEVIAMMKNKGFGREGKGVAEFPNFKTQLTKEGLRFFKGYDKMKKNLGTFNGNFLKEGGNFPFFYGCPELWVGKDGNVYPG